MKKILLPTDFSKNAWNALCYACELYKNEEVNFYIFHAFTVQNYTLDSLMVPEAGEPFFDKAYNQAQHELQKILERIKILDPPSRHSFYTATSYGLPIDAVINYVEEKDIELVITSNKGETDDLDILIGSNAVDFMEKVRNCPVLLVPAGVRFKSFNEIVFPTGFNIPFKRRELNHLYEISKITNAPIRILHVQANEHFTPEQNKKKLLLEECFDGLMYTFHYLENEKVATALQRFTKSRNSDMIAFINTKHSFLGSLFETPLVKKLGHYSKVPVLALHDLRN